MKKIKLFIEKIICLIIRLFCKPYIIFESSPPFSDNTLPVYNELLNRGYNKKYKMVWFIDSETAAYRCEGKTVFWNTNDKSTLKKRFRHFAYYNNVKAAIMCNGYLVPSFFSPWEKSIYLTHGTPIKDISKYYGVPNEIDYCIAPSADAAKAMADCFGYDLKRIIPLGFPRNDVFSHPISNSVETFEHYNKIVVWYPTFRQHKTGDGTSSKHSIPIIHDVESAKELNRYLKEKNMVIVLKPHPAQDTSFISDLGLSNIQYIDDTFFENNTITSYQFLMMTDALLTDYSSIYCDYLLCDKPIGMIWEDIEEYKENPGLYVNYIEITYGLSKIYTLNELLDFLEMVSNNEDIYKETRRELRDRMNISTDGKNTQRVADFIIEKANL